MCRYLTNESQRYWGMKMSPGWFSSRLWGCSDVTVFSSINKNCSPRTTCLLHAQDKDRVVPERPNSGTECISTLSDSLLSFHAAALTSCCCWQMFFSLLRCYFYISETRITTKTKCVWRIRSTQMLLHRCWDALATYVMCVCVCVCRTPLSPVFTSVTKLF